VFRNCDPPELQLRGQLASLQSEPRFAVHDLSGKLWMSKPGLPVLVCLISRRLSFYLTGGNVIAAVRFIWSRPVIA
jgi:hypothetical protein